MYYDLQEFKLNFYFFLFIVKSFVVFLFSVVVENVSFFIIEFSKWCEIMVCVGYCDGVFILLLMVQRFFKVSYGFFIVCLFLVIYEIDLGKEIRIFFFFMLY